MMSPSIEGRRERHSENTEQLRREVERMISEMNTEQIRRELERMKRAWPKIELQWIEYAIIQGVKMGCMSWYRQLE